MIIKLKIRKTVVFRILCKSSISRLELQFFKSWHNRESFHTRVSNPSSISRSSVRRSIHLIQMEQNCNKTTRREAIKTNIFCWLFKNVQNRCIDKRQICFWQVMCDYKQDYTCTCLMWFVVDTSAEIETYFLIDNVNKDLFSLLLNVNNIHTIFS